MNNLIKTVIIRERNVDGSGGFAEVSVYFPFGLNTSDIQKLQESVVEAECILKNADVSTEDVVEYALELFKAHTMQQYIYCDIAVVEFGG